MTKKVVFLALLIIFFAFLILKKQNLQVYDVAVENPYNNKISIFTKSGFSVLSSQEIIDSNRLLNDSYFDERCGTDFCAVMLYPTGDMDVTIYKDGGLKIRNLIHDGPEKWKKGYNENKIYLLARIIEEIYTVEVSDFIFSHIHISEGGVLVSPDNIVIGGNVIEIETEPGHFGTILDLNINPEKQEVE